MSFARLIRPDSSPASGPSHKSVRTLISISQEYELQIHAGSSIRAILDDSFDTLLYYDGALVAGCWLYVKDNKGMRTSTMETLPSLTIFGRHLNGQALERHVQARRHGYATKERHAQFLRCEQPPWWQRTYQLRLQAKT